MVYFKKNEEILLYINLSRLFWGDFSRFPHHPAYLHSHCDHSRMGGSQEESDFFKELSFKARALA